MGSGRSNAKINALYDIQSDQTLGDGSCGTLCRATQKATGLTCAVKTLPNKNLKQANKVEIEIMRSLDHPNVIKLHETFADRKFTYIVMELCIGGDLHARLSASGRLSELQSAAVVQQIVPAIEYLHRKRICHRDLKPENLLLVNCESMDANIVKIIDFGLARRFHDEQVFTTVTGSPHYVAPQVLAGKYNHLSDMWSFGVIMYVMLCGSLPFQGNSEEEVISRVRIGKVAFDFKLWKFVSEAAQDLVSMLLKVEPSERYTAEQIMADEWVWNPPQLQVKRSSLRVTAPDKSSKKGAEVSKKANATSVDHQSKTDGIESSMNGCSLESEQDLNRMFDVIDLQFDAPSLPPRQPLPNPTPLVRVVESN